MSMSGKFWAPSEYFPIPLPRYFHVMIADDSGWKVSRKAYCNWIQLIRRGIGNAEEVMGGDAAQQTTPLELPW